MNVFRAALSSDLWITGIAIARYIPRNQANTDRRVLSEVF